MALQKKDNPKIWRDSKNICFSEKLIILQSKSDFRYTENRFYSIKLLVSLDFVGVNGVFGSINFDGVNQAFAKFRENSYRKKTLKFVLKYT